METKEMKQKNEEILKRWRSLGLLAGLKEGSINEWRCAKSFEEVARYLLADESHKPVVEILSFPFIRSALCTGKKRLYRMIKPEEVVEFFKTMTPLDCVEWLDRFKRNKTGEILLGICKNFLFYNDYGKQTLEEFFENWERPKNDDFKLAKTLLTGLFIDFDFEAELLSAAKNIFVERNSVK